MWTPRHLVTTSMEETWPKTGSVLFLGEWCRRYSRRHVWSRLDGEVVPYHWSVRSNLDADHEQVGLLVEEFLGVIGEFLNGYHDVDHGPRYWRLLIGPWLTRSVHMSFDRWRSMAAALARDEVVSTTVLEAGPNRLVADDLEGFLRAATSDLGNHVFFAHLLEVMDDAKRVDVRRAGVASLDVGGATNGGGQRSRRLAGVPRALEKRLWAGWSEVGSRLTRSDDVMIFETRLDALGEARVALGLGQFPHSWRVSPGVPGVPVDGGARERMADDISAGRGKGFPGIFSRLVPALMPTAYLEGYSELLEAVSSSPWPKNPKAIWTNREWRDEAFKAYAAEKVERGARFVMSQNSGGYGMFPWDTYEENERSISDRYLTWGWEDPADDRVRPVGCTRPKAPVGVRHADQGRALLVTVSFDSPVQMMAPMVNSTAWLSYFADLVRFAKSLAGEARDSLLVRLYRSDAGWNQLERWEDAVPGVDIDRGRDPIEEVLKETRIFISSYNGANNLEALAMGIPTVMFWDPVWWPLRDEAKPYFDDLRRVGIFHESPETAADHVSEVWNDVESWWESSDVRAAVERFTRRFIATPGDLVGRTVDEIRSAIEAPG